MLEAGAEAQTTAATPTTLLTTIRKINTSRSKQQQHQQHQFPRVRHGFAVMLDPVPFGAFVALPHTRHSGAVVRAQTLHAQMALMVVKANMIGKDPPCT